MKHLTIVYELAPGESAHDLIHGGRRMSNIAWSNAVQERDRLAAEVEQGALS